MFAYRMLNPYDYSCGSCKLYGMGVYRQVGLYFFEPGQARKGAA